MLLIVLVFAQFTDPRTIGRLYDEVTIEDRITVPRNGKVSIALFDMKHPSGYVTPPACTVKDLTSVKTHPPVGWIDEASAEKLAFHGFPAGHQLEYTCKGLMKKVKPLGRGEMP